MKRREFIATVGGAAAMWPLSARAQQPRKIPKIGVLWHAGSAEEEGPYLAALREGFRDIGYVDGKTFILENRFPTSNPSADGYRQAATYIDQILRGAKPADLPVQLSVKFELIVNLKTAKAMGLKIPESFLVRADKVIE